MKYYHTKRKFHDGSIRPEVYECFILTLHAKTAAQIACSMAGVNLTHEETDQLSPRAVAVRACDIAQQLVTEFQERGWIIDLPEVIPPPAVEA